MMNDDKTEFVAIGTKSKINQVTSDLNSLSISDYDISFTQLSKTLVST